MVRYTYLKDIPEKFRPTIEKLMDAGIIQGDGSDPTGNGDVIDLSHDQVRTLVVDYRGGAFDRKLMAVGLEPAIQQCPDYILTTFYQQFSPIWNVCLHL